MACIRHGPFGLHQVGMVQGMDAHVSVKLEMTGSHI